MRAVVKIKEYSGLLKPGHPEIPGLITLISVTAT